MHKACPPAALVVVLALSSVSIVHAAAIGEPERTARVGVGVSYSQLSVEDPDGDTGEQTELLPLNIVYTDKFMGAFRYWIEGFYQETTLDPSPTEIGQDVERYGVRFDLQRKLEMISAWDVWASFGVHAAKDKYTVRQSVANDGFLIQQYPDRSDNHLGFDVGAVAEWHLARKWDVVGRVMYAAPFGDGTKEIGASVFFLYSY